MKTVIDISKRTKGDYFYQINPLAKQGESLIRINDKIIARVSGEDTETDQETEANAAFIVTACNAHDRLIEALENVVAYAYAHKETNADADDLTEAMQLLEDIKTL